MSPFERNSFVRDLSACLRVRDERARSNAARRARCQADPNLTALLLVAAKRRGASQIDWPEYFRSIDINYP